MTIYISGPMTGIENYNRDAFCKAEWLLYKKDVTQIGSIINPVNIAEKVKEKKLKPLGISENNDKAYHEFLKADILEMLARADSILMLPGWEKSKGAKLEHDVASACGLAVFYSFDELENYLKDY